MAYFDLQLAEILSLILDSTGTLIKWNSVVAFK